jgi:hypothetical protein
LVAGVHNLSAAAPVVFVATYAAVVVALEPAWLLTIPGAALFGLTQGVAFAFGGAVLGSTALFCSAGISRATRCATIRRGATVRGACSRGRRTRATACGPAETFAGHSLQFSELRAPVEEDHRGRLRA